MLFETTSELKKYIPANISLEFDDIKPYIALAETRFIIPVLGKAQYNKLQEVFTNGLDQSSGSGSGSGSGSLYDEDAHNDLLDKVRLPLANFAFLLYIPMAQVQISSSGIHISRNENKTAAFNQQIDDLKRSFQDSGYVGIDILLEFLEENKSIYTLWAASDAFTIFRESFINKTADFNKIININNSRRTFLTLKPIMKRVEDHFVKPSLCDDLFDEIKQEIRDGNVSGLNQKLLDLIQPAISHLTISEAIDELTIIYSDYGLSVFPNDTSIKRVDDEEMAQTTLGNLKIKSRQNGETYLRQLRDYLNANADDYPLYKDSDCFIDPDDGNEDTENDKNWGIIGL